MGELTSALDALAADDLHALGSAALLDRTAELVRAVNRMQAELARTVRVAELTQAPEHDGLTSMRSWLRGHARLSTGAAASLVRAGRVCEQLPAVAAGFADGQITAEQIAVIGPPKGSRWTSTTRPPPGGGGGPSTHEGASRVPRRTTTRRPMAHLRPDGSEILLHQMLG